MRWDWLRSSVDASRLPLVRGTGRRRRTNPPRSTLQSTRLRSSCSRAPRPCSYGTRPNRSFDGCGSATDELLGLWPSVPRSGSSPRRVHLTIGPTPGTRCSREPGEKWDPEHDLIFLLSDGVRQRMFVNGSLMPPLKELEVGKTYRLLIADIAVFRLSLPVRLIRD